MVYPNGMIAKYDYNAQRLDSDIGNYYYYGRCLL